MNINNSVVAIDAKRGRNKMNSISEFRNHNKTDLIIKVSSNQYGYEPNKKILTIPFYYFPFFLNGLNSEN